MRWSQERYQAKKDQRARKRKENIKYPWDWLSHPDPVVRFTALLTVFTAGLFVVGGMQVFIIWMQLQEAKIEQRPWAYAQTVEPAGHISLEGGKYIIPLKIHIKNIGKLPAFFVVHKTGAEIIQLKDENRGITGVSPITIRNYVCDTYKEPGKDEGNGVTIFPDQEVVKGGFERADYPRIDKAAWDAMPGDKVIIVFGCVDYKSPGDQIHHQSRFSFGIGIRKQQGILDRIGPLPNDPTTVDIGLLPAQINDGIPAD